MVMTISPRAAAKPAISAAALPALCRKRIPLHFVSASTSPRITDQLWSVLPSSTNRTCTLSCPSPATARISSVSS